jgi:hypothetical protein
MKMPRPTLAALLLLLAACASGTPSQPSDTSTTTTISTELFSGTLGPAETSFYSFTVLVSGNVSVMLASITSGTGQPVAPLVSLAVGVPSGTICSATTSVDATPALKAQITNLMSSGTYCVRVSDSSAALTDSVNFTIRIIHP